MVEGDDSGLLAEDDKTLRLATPEITPEKLDRLISFQKSFLAAARKVGDKSDAALSAIHDEAVQKSGIPPREIAELEALVRAYAGRRWTLRALERRLAEAQKRLDEASAQHKPHEVRDLVAAEKLPEEILQRSKLTALEHRYGQAAIALLHEREAELLALHEELGKVLRR